MTPSDARNEPAAPCRSSALRLLAVGLVLVCGLAGIGVARWLNPNRAPADAPAATTGIKMPARYFRNWEKPDLVLVLTGSQHGYLFPCGCSNPQLGGLERRWNFVQVLREMGWPVVAFDVGDIPQMRGPMGLPNEQGLIKYRYAMSALKRIGYTAVSLGEYESALPLQSALAEYALQDPVPRVLAANLKNRATEFPDQVEAVQLAAGGTLKVGVTAILGPTVLGRIKARDASVEGEKSPVPALDAALAKMDADGAGVRVLLYQGLTNNPVKGGEPKEAVAAAKKYPQFQVILCVGEDDEPSADPLTIGDTLICSMGHKGKYAGVVGIWKTTDPAKPFRFEYQLVPMSEEFLTPKDREAKHPIVQLMEEYAQELKRENYLGRYGQTKHPLQVLPTVPGVKPETPAVPAYVGSEKCKNCHEHAYDVWQASPHHHAYETLVDYQKRPGLRQHDAECIVCHTVGFGYQTGFSDAAKTPHLKGVGCESCHGPGGNHAMNPNSAEWQLRMNPWKAPDGETQAQKTKREARIDQFCQRCHDIDNDVTWSPNGFERKWPKIRHPSNGGE